MEPALTDDQAAVYDRQLRVWGVEVQKKLTAARVLVVGFGQLAAEIAKNITLAGVGQVTLLDDRPAADHAGRNFLINAADAAAGGQTAAEAAAKTLQAMNPLVAVAAAAGAASDAAAPDSELLARHDLLVATGLPLAALQRLNEACRACRRGFMAAGAAGPAGWFFLDLQQHSFTPKGGSKPGERQVLQYSSFADALAPQQQQQPGSTTHPLYLVLQACLQLEQQLQRPLAPADQPAAQQLLTAAAAAAGVGAAQQESAAQLLAAVVAGAPECAPVVAVLGGLAANNVLAAVSGSGAPLNNLVFFSLADCRAIVETRPQQQPGEPAAAAHAAARTAAAAAEVVLD